MTGIVRISTGANHTLALKADGTLRAWGKNDTGQVGDGTTTNRSSAVQVKDPNDATTFLTGVTKFAAGIGQQSLVIKSNGTVWAWGRNLSGQLGNNSTTNSSSPVQVQDANDGSGFLQGALQVAAGDQHSLALKSDGTVRTWGLNDSGQLGDGTTTARSTAVQASGLTNITQINAGQKYSLAISRSPRLDVFAASGYYGQVITLTARLRGRPSGNSLTGKTITFSIDGTSVGTGATNVNGYAQFAHRLSDTLAIGSHTLAADFAGDADYASSSATATLTTLITNTTLSSVALSGTIGQTQGLKVRLKRTSDLDGVVGQTILLSVDGSVVGTATTDAQGFAVYAYAIPELSAGSHTLTASFTVTSQYAASNSSGTLTVSKSDTKLPTDQITGSQSSSVNLIAYLKRSTDGSRLAGPTVTFKVDGVVVGAAATDVNGLATLPYTLSLTLGTHKISTVFAGDAFDNSSTGGSDLIVTVSP